ncbi:MAG: PAS domain S-box protein [Pyrinomonadaceae bacterium]|nr:PAS domain S-box protein [Pyrinomonadaceae bacterium]
MSERAERYAQLFRVSLEQSPMSTQILSPDGFTIWVNYAWEKLWGVQLAQISHYNILEDRQLIDKGVMPFIRKAFEGEATEIPAILYDPEETIPNATTNAEPRRWVRGFIYPVKDEEGRVREIVLTHEDITESKLIEEELRHSEEKYRSLLENANDIIYSHDLEGKYLTINRAGEKITGYTREEILGGLNIAQVVAPEHLQLAKEMTARKLKDPAPTVYEVDIITRDGRRLTLEVSTRISYRNNQPVAVEGIARDVTERKRAEAELQRSRNQLEIILQGVAESITAQDAEGKLIYANDAAARALGFSSAKELLEYPVQELMKRYELLDETSASFSREQLPGRIAIKEGRPASATICYRSRATGEERWSFVQSTPVFDEQQQVRFAINIFQDITERRRVDVVQRFLAEAGAVIASSLDYEATLASVARMSVPTLADWCSVDVYDEDHTLKRLAVAHVDPKKIEWAHELQQRYPPNMEAERGVPHVLRTGRSEIYPVITDEMLVAGALDEEHLRIMREIGFTSAIIVPLVTQGRTLGAITFITAESGRHYTQEDLVMAETLAHRAAIAIDNARLYRRAQEANRMKDEFLATLSHELRTPLTAILGWSSMLRAGQLDNETARRAFEAIERNAKSQRQIIEDLLDVSRIITGKLRLDLREVEPSLLIDSAIEAVRPAAEAKGVRIQKLTGTGVSHLTGDPSRLQQVFWNLLSNAVKFTPAGGRVQISLERKDSQLEIAVSDTGQGISAEFLPYVFDRFRQADSTTTRKHGGLGLGLAIVRHLVELHGGTVRAESAGVGQGATFTVTLPLVSDYRQGAEEELVQMLRRDEQSALECPERLDGLKILAVDDEADTRELLRVTLTKCGAEVTTASSAREALNLLSASRPDVLISDIGMPDEDGYELIKRIRELPEESGGGIPAVALTAYARAEDRLRILRSGYQMHVAKPVELAELIAVIASLTGRQKR